MMQQRKTPIAMQHFEVDHRMFFLKQNDPSSTQRYNLTSQLDPVYTGLGNVWLSCTASTINNDHNNDKDNENTCSSASADDGRGRWGAGRCLRECFGARWSFWKRVDLWERCGCIDWLRSTCDLHSCLRVAVLRLTLCVCGHGGWF